MRDRLDKLTLNLFGEDDAETAITATRQQGIEREPIQRTNRKNKGREPSRPTTRRLAPVEKCWACDHPGPDCPTHG